MVGKQNGFPFCAVAAGPHNFRRGVLSNSLKQSLSEIASIYDTGRTSPRLYLHVWNFAEVFTACVGSIRLLQISCRGFDKARRLEGVPAMRVIVLATTAIPGPHIQFFSCISMKTRCSSLAYIKTFCTGSPL